MHTSFASVFYIKIIFPLQVKWYRGVVWLLLNKLWNTTMCFHLISTDINECQEGIAKCHKNAYCFDKPGAYNCQCKSGFKGDGIKCWGK